MLRNICENFEIEIKYFHNSQTINNLSEMMINMKNWISNKDLRSIAHWILNLNNNLLDAIELYKICLDNLENEIKLPRNKLVKDFENALKLSLNTNVILLAKIIYLIGKSRTKIGEKYLY